jgi:hypothetical protein
VGSLVRREETDRELSGEPMPAAYVLFMRLEAVSLYKSLRRPEKETLERFFDFLERYPDFKGETTERDEAGRAVEVKFVGKFKVVYWPDHAVKEIKVLKVERLPRR